MNQTESIIHNFVSKDIVMYIMSFLEPIGDNIRPENYWYTGYIEKTAGANMEKAWVYAYMGGMTTMAVEMFKRIYADDPVGGLRISCEYYIDECIRLAVDMGATDIDFYIYMLCRDSEEYAQKREAPIYPISLPSANILNSLTRAFDELAPPYIIENLLDLHWDVPNYLLTIACDRLNFGDANAELIGYSTNMIALAIRKGATSCGYEFCPGHAFA